MMYRDCKIAYPAKVPSMTLPKVEECSKSCFTVRRETSYAGTANITNLSYADAVSNFDVRYSIAEFDDVAYAFVAEDILG